MLETDLRDLDQSAIIREVHVYGQSLEVGSKQTGLAQHAGLGSDLIHQAEIIARQHGFQALGGYICGGNAALLSGTQIPPGGVLSGQRSGVEGILINFVGERRRVVMVAIQQNQRRAVHRVRDDL